MTIMVLAAMSCGEQVGTSRRTQLDWNLPMAKDGILQPDLDLESRSYNILAAVLYSEYI